MSGVRKEIGLALMLVVPIWIGGVVVGVFASHEGHWALIGADWMGAIGEWVGGGATLVAVLIALRIAGREERERADVRTIKAAALCSAVMFDAAGFGRTVMDAVRIMYEVGFDDDVRAARIAATLARLEFPSLTKLAENAEVLPLDTATRSGRLNRLLSHMKSDAMESLRYGNTDADEEALAWYWTRVRWDITAAMGDVRHLSDETWTIAGMAGPSIIGTHMSDEFNAIGERRKSEAARRQAAREHAAVDTVPETAEPNGESTNTSE